MDNELSRFLSREYGLEAQSIRRMTTGVGGDTYRVDASSGSCVFKIVKADAINHPEQEAALCRYLREQGIPASEFLPNRRGALTSAWDGSRICHLQRFVDGEHYPMNAAPECAAGGFDEARLAAQCDAYGSIAPLQLFYMHRDTPVLIMEKRILLRSW